MDCCGIEKRPEMKLLIPPSLLTDLIKGKTSNTDISTSKFSLLQIFSDYDEFFITS